MRRVARRAFTDALVARRKSGASASCFLLPLPGLFLQYIIPTDAAIPPPVLDRHPHSHPLHIQRLHHARKGLLGIHLDTALVAFAHLGARHDTLPIVFRGWERLRPTALARFGARIPQRP